MHSGLDRINQPLWQDVVPIKQEDGPEPLAVIRYPPGFEEAHDYFRAIQVADEYSERALELTGDVIEFNSANYTAWYYRRRCLSALHSDLQSELEFTNRWAQQNAKNYQVWYHRRWLIAELMSQISASEHSDKSEKLSELGRQELEFHQDVMVANDDFKNYNGWSHRQFIVKKFDLWDEELPFLESLLSQDLLNNSAWNHRYIVVRNTEWPLLEATRKRELDFTIGALRQTANNESAWNYLAAFFGDGEGREAWDARPEVEAICLETAFEGSSCRFAIETLAHVLEAKGETARAVEQYNLLKAADAIRAPYWGWRIALLEQKLVF